MTLDWNEKVNLTSITEPAEFVEKHFLDSLSIMDSYEIEDAEKIIDISKPMISVIILNYSVYMSDFRCFCACGRMNLGSWLMVSAGFVCGFSSSLFSPVMSSRSKEPLELLTV